MGPICKNFPAFPSADKKRGQRIPCALDRVEPNPPWTISFAEVPMEKKGDQIVEGAVETRAGFPDCLVLLVLVASCVLAIVFLVPTFVGVVKL
jgi:hypothetical protein